MRNNWKKSDVRWSRTTPLALVLVFAALAAACGSSGGSSPIDLSNDGFDWRAVFKGGSTSLTPIGRALPPQDLKLQAADNGIGISWKIPRSYRAKNLAIGYIIYRKTFIAGKSDKWDFSPTSTDFDEVLAEYPAQDCDADGVCRVLDPVLVAANLMYAVIGVWDLPSKSGASEHVEGLVSQLQIPLTYSFEKGFMDQLPVDMVGLIVNEAERRASTNVFKLTPTRIPWFLLEADKSSATAPPWSLGASPLEAPLDPGDGMTMLLPNQAYYRGVVLGRGDLSFCGSEEASAAFKSLCEQIMRANPYSTLNVIGQVSDSRALPPETNTLPKSRTFESRSMTIGYGPSGTRYVFVADRQRILVRKGSIHGCALDPGESGDDRSGPEGTCGFHWSIGTHSPRMTCAFRADGSVAREEGGACGAADEAYSAADSTAPTAFSLRDPGAPIFVGPHLYIPDTGNARVVKIANFEAKIAACGRLRAAGDTSVNEFCGFDFLLGQYGSTPDDPARFAARSCVRGGERGGFAGAAAVPDDTQFTDPTGGTGSGGAACRRDTYSFEVGGATVYRKWRAAADFRDDQRSHMSPETGLLAEITKRMFRAPAQIATDARGRLYVLDHGTTRVRSAIGESEAVLPPRIMVWQRDPLSLQACVPKDPAAKVPSCAINQEGLCKGEGCVDRQCDAAECNATFALGQNALLYGFTVPAGTDIFTLKPDGYAPITAFAVTSVGGMSGVWAVTGRDGRFFHWADPSQVARPVIHNEFVPAVDEADGGYANFRRRVFSGLTLDPLAGVVMGWDVKFHQGVGWKGLSPKTE